MRLLDVLREQWLLLVINGGRLGLICLIFTLAPHAGTNFMQTILIYSCAMFFVQFLSGWLVLHRMAQRAATSSASAMVISYENDSD